MKELKKVDYELVDDLVFNWERENEDLISQFKKNLKDFDFDEILREGLLSKERTIRTSVTFSPLDQKIIDNLGFAFAGNRNLRFKKLINFLFGIVKSIDFNNLVMTGEVRDQLIAENDKILNYELKKIKKLYKSQSLDKKIDKILKELK